MFIPVEEIINKYEQARPGSEKNSLPSCSLFSSSYLNLPFEKKRVCLFENNYRTTLNYNTFTCFSCGQKDLLHKERP